MWESHLVISCLINFYYSFRPMISIIRQSLINQLITLLKTKEKNTQENYVNKNCRYLSVFLNSRDKNSILLLACFGLIFTRSLTLLRLLIFPASSSSFLRSARAESNTGSGIFINILHSKKIKCNVYYPYNK